MKKAVIICALGIGFVGGNAMSSEVDSNHYSRVYNRHGAKAKVGNSIRSANATKGVWAYASATGNRTDTFSCWYNPTGWY
ncbi:hypothetical protein EHH26_05885 [Enterococcus faecium]|nr:hypothetical protein [Enterococcus faecium]